jgi:hypothetical protein
VDSSLFTVGLGPIGADGTIHAVLERAKLAVPSEIRAHSPDNGKLLWNVPIPGLHAMPNVPVLRDDGVLLVGMVLDHEQANETTVLVAVQTRSPGLARSGWPRDHHDNRNTCNAGSPLP